AADLLRGRADQLVRSEQRHRLGLGIGDVAVHRRGNDSNPVATGTFGVTGGRTPAGVGGPFIEVPVLGHVGLAARRWFPSRETGLRCSTEPQLVVRCPVRRTCCPLHPKCCSSACTTPGGPRWPPHCCSTTPEAGWPFVPPVLPPRTPSTPRWSR